MLNQLANKEHWKSNFLEIYKSIKADKIIYGLIIIFSITVTIIANLNGYDTKSQLTGYLLLLPTVLQLSFIIGSIGYFIVLVYRKEKRPLYCFWQQIIFFYEQRYQIISAFLLLVVISVFSSYYSTFKAMIPVLHPFEFDESLRQMDLWLFLGNEPWRLIHNLYQSPWVTLGLDFAYNVWFFLVYGVLITFLVTQNGQNRRRYVLAWLLCWIVIGNLLALLFSSVGPTFIGRLAPDHTSYEPLMALLHQQDRWIQQHVPSLLIWSLNTQDSLWTSYSTGKEMLGSGISAMPSMHVSMSVLMALGVGSINRKLGIIFWCFSFIIYIGSFTLGWHYAVDGLVSGPITVVIWYLCGSKSILR